MENQALAVQSIPSFQQYIEDRKYIKNVSPRTLSWYSDVWKAFGPHLEPVLASGGRLNDALRAGVTSLLSKGIRPISVNSYLTGVRAYLNWLHAEQWLKEKPKVQLLKHEQKVIATFSPEQVQKLLGFKPRGTNQTRTYVGTCVMLDSGLRLSEVLELRMSDIDFDNLLLKVKGKGNKQRLVPMSNELRRIVYRHSLRQTDSTLLFGTRCGTRVTNRNFLRDFKDLCTRTSITGVRASPHTLRHTFAVGYLRAGGNLFYLSKILGHTSVKTTERYLQSVQVGDLQAVHSRLSLLSRRG
jgi:integrase/recombinase XerD